MNSAAMLILLIVKIVCTAFFTFVFFGNLATFFTDRVKPTSFDIYLESQIWMLISLLAITFIWRVLP